MKWDGGGPREPWTLIGIPVECDCGASVPVRADRWHGKWIQLQPHRQPKTGLLCSTGRLLPVLWLATVGA